MEYLLKFTIFLHSMIFFIYLNISSHSKCFLKKKTTGDVQWSKLLKLFTFYGVCLPNTHGHFCTHAFTESVTFFEIYVCLVDMFFSFDVHLNQMKL